MLRTSKISHDSGKRPLDLSSVEEPKSSSNFHLSFMVLPKSKRQAMFDFYEYCRYADDLVDEVGTHSMGEAKRGLAELCEEVERSYAGRATTVLGKKLERLVQTYAVQKKDLLDIIHGCEWDLSKNRYATFQELYQYCYCVASAVGLVSIEIFGYNDERTRDYAVNLGLAFQLTNILRDLTEDAKRGRIYLPQEDLQSFGYSELMLLEGKASHAFDELMNFECQRTLGFYHQAEVLLASPDSRSLVAAQIMRAIYFEIFQSIRENPRIVLNEKVSVSKPRKIYKALCAFLESYIR